MATSKVPHTRGTTAKACTEQIVVSDKVNQNENPGHCEDKQAFDRMMDQITFIIFKVS